MIFLFPWWDMLIPWRVYLPTYCHFSHQNQWNPWIGCEAPSSELEDHRFCTDCWEERVEPPGIFMDPNDFFFKPHLAEEMRWDVNEKLKRWILFLAFGRVKFWMFLMFICSCKWCSHGTPFAISCPRFSLKTSLEFVPGQEPTSQFLGGWPRTFCNMPGVVKRPWSALCVVARSLSLRWIADGQRCRGVWVVERDGNMILGNFWRIEMEILKSCVGNSFFCWQLLSSQVEEVENARCPTWSREKSDESATDIYHFSCWSSISEMSWAVKKPCLFSVYGVDFTTPFIQKVLWYATTRIWTHHYNGKSFPDLKIPHLFMMAVSPSHAFQGLFTEVKGPTIDITPYLHWLNPWNSLSFFWREGERRRYKVHSTIQKVGKSTGGFEVSTAKMPVSFQISKWMFPKIVVPPNHPCL